MKKILLITVSCLALAACLIPRKSVENVNVDNGYGSLTLSGYAIRIPFCSDIKIGDWKAYYPSGALGKEIKFYWGRPQYYIEYYPDGTSLLQGSYASGKPAGHWIGHHPNGKVSVRNDFGVSSQEPITQDIFDLNGILMIHYDARTNLITDYRKKAEPNQASEPTTMAVTPPALQEPRQP